MAAFINALGEEGTLQDCRKWVDKMRQENDTMFSIKESKDMDKDECIIELNRFWYYENNIGN